MTEKCQFTVGSGPGQQVNWGRMAVDQLVARYMCVWQIPEHRLCSCMRAARERPRGIQQAVFRLARRPATPVPEDLSSLAETLGGTARESERHEHQRRGRRGRGSKEREVESIFLPSSAQERAAHDLCSC